MDPSEEWSCMEDVNKNAPEESEATVDDVGEIVEQQPSDTVQSGQSKNGGTSSKSKSGQNKNRNKKDKSDDKGDNGQKQVSLIFILCQLSALQLYCHCSLYVFGRDFFLLFRHT